MIKATLNLPDGTRMLMLGLSHANLDRLRTESLDGFIRINGDEIGWPRQMIIIFAGKNEADLTGAVAKLIGTDTKVHISEKLKQ